jgi:hypothetical protein
MKITYRQKFNKVTSWRLKIELVAMYHAKKLLLNKDWSTKKTADYFGISLTLAQENLRISRYLNDTAVKEATSRNKAIKYIREHYE